MKKRTVTATYSADDLLAIILADMGETLGEGDTVRIDFNTEVVGAISWPNESHGETVVSGATVVIERA